MRFFTSLASATATVVFISVSAFAQEYVTIDMEIDIDKPAAEVWQKVGDYCGISEWLGLDCEITSGDGGMGSVRSLLGGAFWKSWWRRLSFPMAIPNRQ